MSDNENMEERDRAEQNEALEPSYRYRWNYGDQCAYESAQARKKKKSGAAVYAIIMTAVFLLCFGLLIGVLVWYHADDLSVPTGSAMTTGEVATLVKPSTVLIYGANTTSYGYGTGFFISSDGYIATNYHVVNGFHELTVTLYSGEVLQAQYIGGSEPDDLAVLKVSGKNHPAVTVGDSSTVCVGDVAIAIGNPSGPEGSWTTTQGIISAQNRDVTVTGEGTIIQLRMIQTDAPVSSGNSGGPLCNDAGEVIGIISRKLTDHEGIGLALPINGAMKILNAIIKDGNADGVQSTISRVRPTVGITGVTIKAGTQYTMADKNGINRSYTAQSDGVLVHSVDAGGPAGKTLEVGDIIVAMDGKAVTDLEMLTELLYQYKVGDKVSVTFLRNGVQQTKTFVLGKA